MKKYGKSCKLTLPADCLLANLDLLVSFYCLGVSLTKTLPAEYSELKKTILMCMAYSLDKTSLHELRDIFVVLDTEASGTVTLMDLKNALQQVHSDRHMDDETIEKLFHGIDGECCLMPVAINGFA